MTFHDHKTGAPALASKSPRPSRRTSRTAFTAAPPAADDPLLGFAPYLHKQPRKNAITPDRQRAFISALAASGIVTQAAREIGASMEALYKLRQLPGAEGFAAAWEAAIDRGVARLEDCLLARALEGEERPIVSAGKLLGTWRHFDNRLAMFLLRQRRPARWGQADAFAALRPGHPVYERLRAEWLARDAEDEEEIIASINAKLDAMQAREAAVRVLLAAPDAEEEAEEA
ncbi:hypothetical protein [Novosphingobium sp.]|uniref:hypothetical protein n=1 Tax=Novosphingobium sp. TaxID=1874826 RepID=UPI00286DAF5D|nr:hypothetical protein [Novosphingobium sp.]